MTQFPVEPGDKNFMKVVTRMMDVQRQEMEKYKAWGQRKLSQEKGRQDGSAQNSPMKTVRVTLKQMHQMNMRQLIPPPSLAPSEKGMLWRAAAPVEAEATMGLVPRPEDGHMILSLSPHGALSPFQASDTVHLRNWIFLWWVLREGHCFTGDRDLPDHHSTMSTRWTSPVGDFVIAMCCLFRLPQLFCTCVAFSLVADMGFLRGVIEVAGLWAWYELKEIFFYEHTTRALLKVLETFVAGVIFAFLSNTSLYLHQLALEWCVAVYSICFILAAVVLLQGLAEWKYMPPRPFSIFQLVLSLLSVLLYVSSLVLWLLYQFSEEFGGLPQRFMDESCVDGLSYDMWAWDQCLAVAVLTAINLLVYVADLGYWARQASAGTEDVSSAPDSVQSHPVTSQSEDIL
ncbi:hypothetical protein MG293_014778 [Ovis ammon polii]|uniref:MARVEL domain-containing protein n=1 Tax=Ovis ammon polii TaxID=230172 RepID=A0AAD4TZI1_OVIAM|nr:hypothetical protein MG293_014778 [Ovis ammon polii]